MRNSTPKPTDMVQQMENGENINPDDITNYREHFDRFANHVIGEHPDDTVRRHVADK